MGEPVVRPVARAFAAATAANAYEAASCAILAMISASVAMGVDPRTGYLAGLEDPGKDGDDDEEG